FPPRVDNPGDLAKGLVLEISIVVGGFYGDFVSAIAGRELKHPDRLQFDLGKDSKSRELVWYDPREPASLVWGIAIIANREYLWWRLILSARTKRAARPGLGRLIFATGLGRFWPLSARRRNNYPPSANRILS